MRIGLMVEGQNGLTWERWAHILDLAERLGFPTVFRSDHYFIGRQQDSLEAYLSFVMAAIRTSTIRFGPLVSPVTFRSPADVARMAAQIDVLSGGRFVMGLGAGWNEAEHRAYGIPFPSIGERFDRLEEAIQLTKALWAGPATVALPEGAWGPVQASAGALAAVRVLRSDDPAELAGGAPLCALVPRGGMAPAELPRTARWLVVGGEADGIPPAWLERCGERLTLPMPGDAVESLNAAVAGAVAMYACFVRS